MTLPSTRDLLAGGDNGRTAKFPMIGTTYSGDVLAVSVRQARDFDTREALTWDDGSPRLEIVVTLQTKEIDPTDAEDDGRRAVYIKWWGQTRTNFQTAVTRDAGVPDIEVGGWLIVTFTEEIPSKRGNPAKVFSFRYKPPSPTAGLFANGSASAPTSSPAEATPPATPAVSAPATPPAESPVAAVQRLAAAGLTAAQIATVVPSLTAETVAAILSIPI